MLNFGLGTPEAPWGPYREPATISVAGDTACGKSTDLCRAFGPGLWAMSVTGGLKPAAGVWGLELRRSSTIEDLHTAKKRLVRFLALPADHEERAGVIAIALDNVSQPASASHARHEAAEEARVAKANARGGGQEVKPNLFAVWGATMDLLLELRDMCRTAGFFFAINGDERGPSTDEKGAFHKGGLSLPSKGRTADFARMTDLVLLARRRPETRPPQLWGGRYLCGHDPSAYHGRDRHHVAPVDGPANLGELLRGAGYYLPRHPLMDGWAEPLIAAGAETLRAAGAEGGVEALGAVRTALVKARTKLATRVYPGQETLLQAHIRWVFADTLDRAEIVLYHQRLAEELLREETPADGAAAWTLRPNMLRPRQDDLGGDDLL